MRTGVIDDEMRRRFEASQKTPIADTPLARPALRIDEPGLRAHFADEVGRAQTPLENPHVEPRVSEAQRRAAVPASVLIGVVPRDPEPTLLVTRRHHGISYPGHWVFPGGRADPEDATPFDTALRETHEEIGLDLGRVEVLGRLGDYVSHSGFRIAPTVALVHPPFDLVPHPAEVDAIAEIALSQVLDSGRYFLYRFEERVERAHFALDARAETTAEEIMLTGVTASICIGLYTELLKTHHR